MLPDKLLLDKSSISKWRCVRKKCGSAIMFLSRSQPESNSTFNWNEGIHPGICRSTTRLELPERSITSRFVRFLSQMKENLPLKLLPESWRALNDDGRFDDWFIRIVLQSNYMRDPIVEYVEAKTRMLECFHWTGWLPNTTLVDSWEFEMLQE